MIKLYYHPSPNPFKVALFLEECGLEYELAPVDTRKGEQHQPWFLAINPERQDTRPGRRRRHCLRQQCGPALPGREDRPLPASATRHAARAADVFVADVRGHGHRPLFGTGGALQALRARARRTMRSTATTTRRCATGASWMHSWRGTATCWATTTRWSTWRYGAGDARAVHPRQRCLGQAAAGEAADRRDQRAARGPACRGTEGPHAFKTDFDDEARKALFPQNARLQGGGA